MMNILRQVCSQRCWLATLAIALLLNTGISFAAGEADIQKTLIAYHDALGSNDLGQVEQYVVADERFVMLEGKHSNWGWEDYRDNHLASELEDLSKVKFSLDFKALKVSGDLAYATFIFSMAPKSDPSQNWGSGRATAILVRGPKGWLIQQLHTS